MWMQLLNKRRHYWHMATGVLIGIYWHPHTYWHLRLVQVLVSKHQQSHLKLLMHFSWHIRCKEKGNTYDLIESPTPLKCTFVFPVSKQKWSEKLWRKPGWTLSTSINQQKSALISTNQHINQHINQHQSASVSTNQHQSAYISTNQHINQHQSALVSIIPHICHSFSTDNICCQRFIHIKYFFFRAIFCHLNGQFLHHFWKFSYMAKFFSTGAACDACLPDICHFLTPALISS